VRLTKDAARFGKDAEDGRRDPPAIPHSASAQVNTLLLSAERSNLQRRHAIAKGSAAGCGSAGVAMP